MSTPCIPPLLTACSQFKILLCLPSYLVFVTHIPTSLLSSLGGNPYLTSLHLYFSPIRWYFPCPILSPAARPTLQPWRDGFLPQELPEGRVGQSVLSVVTYWSAWKATEQLGEPPQDRCHQNGTLKPSTLWTSLGDTQIPTDHPPLGHHAWEEAFHPLIPRGPFPPQPFFGAGTAELHVNRGEGRDTKLSDLLRVMEVCFELHHWASGLFVCLIACLFKTNRVHLLPKWSLLTNLIWDLRQGTWPWTAPTDIGCWAAAGRCWRTVRWGLRCSLNWGSSGKMVWAYTGTAEKFEANLQGAVLPALMDSAALDNEIKASVESPGQHRKAMPLPTFIRKTKLLNIPAMKNILIEKS